MDNITAWVWCSIPRDYIFLRYNSITITQRYMHVIEGHGKWVLESGTVPAEAAPLVGADHKLQSMAKSSRGLRFGRNRERPRAKPKHAIILWCLLVFDPKARSKTIKEWWKDVDKNCRSCWERRVLKCGHTLEWQCLVCVVHAYDKGPSNYTVQ